jgi:hypothetical protein
MANCASLLVIDQQDLWMNQEGASFKAFEKGFKSFEKGRMSR